MLASHLLQSGRSAFSSPLTLLYFLGILYFYVDACWICPILNTTIPFCALDIVGKSAGMTLIPLFYLWVRKVWKGKKVPGLYYILFAIPLLILGSQITIFTMMGWDDSEAFLHRMFVNPSMDNLRGTEYDIILGRTYLKICYHLYNAIMVGEAFLMFFLIGRDTLMHKKNLEWSGTARQLMISDISCLVIAAVIIIRMVLGVTWLTENWEVSALLSVVIASALFCLGSSVSAINVLEMSMAPETDSVELEPSYMNSLKEDFEKLILVDRIYLDRKLTIEKVSMMLHTNRTYLGKMIRDNYGCSFRDYITGKRIAFVKSYMLQHPSEKLDIVSVACGYSDASHLAKRFKDYEGTTPKQWLERQLSN